MEDISSQEMDRPEENGRKRPAMIQMLEKHNAADTDRQNVDFMKEINAIIQIFASRMNLKNQTGKPHDADKHQQESHKRAMDFDSPEFVDTPDTPDLDADSEERGGHGISPRQISGQSQNKSILLRNIQTNTVNETLWLNYMQESKQN